MVAPGLVRVRITCRYATVTPSLRCPIGAQADSDLGFLKVNRNKRSLALSFKEKAGVDIITNLASRADVLVENYLPGSLKKYGLDYQSLAAVNSRLIYASVTGYGQTGPYSDRAGYDVMVEA